MKNLILIFATGVIISTITSLTVASDLELFYEHIEMVETSKKLEEEILDLEVTHDVQIVLEEQEGNDININLNKELSLSVDVFNKK